MNYFKRFYFQISCVLIAIFVLFPRTSTEHYGDRLQYALPLVGAFCSVGNKEFSEYATRALLGFSAVHITKNGLGKIEFNKRPNGGHRGFPSGHTAAATYGASYVVRACARRIPLLGPIAIAGAAYTGGSRIESGWHNTFQVVAGVLYGLFFDLSFRSARSRAFLKKYFGRKSKKSGDSNAA